MPQLISTSAVVTRASASTTWIVTLSSRQLRRVLEERWRQGSPKVLASPPQPQTQEQYQRLPKKKASSGAATSEARKL